MHHVAECVGSLNDIARGGEGWDVPRLGTEFINAICRVNQLRQQDIEERARRAEIKRRRDALNRRRR